MTLSSPPDAAFVRSVLVAVLASVLLHVGQWATGDALNPLLVAAVDLYTVSVVLRLIR